MSGVVAGLPHPARVFLPVVGDVVVHLGGVPVLPGQEAHGVDVEGLRFPDGDRDLGPLALDGPALNRHDLSRGAVHDLPPPFHVTEIRLHLEPVVAGHDVDGQRTRHNNG